MLAARRISVYLVVFIVLLALFFATDLWKRLDYVVYESLYLEDANNLRLRPELALIDLRHPSADQPHLADDVATGIFRRRLLSLLDYIAEKVDNGERPRALVLDLYFSNLSAERQPLFNALKRLVDAKVKVYAVFNTLNAASSLFENRLSEHAAEFYDMFQGRYLHTSMTRYGNVLIYHSEVEFARKSGQAELIEALPQRVARDLDSKLEPPLELTGYVLPLGSELIIDSQTHRFLIDEQANASGKMVTLSGEDAPDFSVDEKILLVGSVAIDQPLGVSQAGPKLVAWALDDQLNRNENARTPLDNPALVIGLVVFFTLFTVIIYALLFKFVKSLQTKPLVLAVVAYLISVAMLAVVAAGILAMGSVMPVGLSLVSMFLAALLSWRYAYKFLVTGVIEGAGKYDVFISYSRKDSDWVVKNIYDPLKALRKPDGSELAIFFDRDEIGMGEAFTAKYMWAIVDSVFFIPVFSDTYYGSHGHTRNEMDLAYKRSVEKKLTMLPITRSFEAVPEIYTHLNFTDVNEQPAFFEQIKANLLGKAERS